MKSTNQWWKDWKPENGALTKGGREGKMNFLTDYHAMVSSVCCLAVQKAYPTQRRKPFRSDQFLVLQGMDGQESAPLPVPLTPGAVRMLALRQLDECLFELPVSIGMVKMCQRI